jgi:teichuronic acid biosynthesis glycosyltransferase TuaG
VARNDAIARSRGRYVAMLDGDDFWIQEKLERQVDFMRQYQAAVSYTSYRRISKDGTRMGAIVRIPKSLSYTQLLGNSAIVNSTAIVDRQIAGEPRWTVGYGHEDFIFWLDLLRKGMIAHGLAEDLTRWRYVPGSLSGNKLRSARWVWRIYREHEHLSLARSLWYLSNWGTRAAIKRSGRHRPRARP